MEDKETSSAIIGIRVEQRVKKKLQDIAERRGETLSRFLCELIAAGWDVVVKQKSQEDVEQK